MSNARSLSARWTPAATLRGALSARWAQPHGSGCDVAPALPLVAQVCTVEMRSVTGTVVTGDKSYSADPQRPRPCGRHLHPPQPERFRRGLPVLSAPCPPQSRSATSRAPDPMSFDQGGNLHYSPADGGSATCWYDGSVPTPCLRCSGSFAFTFYSKSGALKGKVRYRPDRGPHPLQIGPRRSTLGRRAGPHQRERRLSVQVAAIPAEQLVLHRYPPLPVVPAAPSTRSRPTLRTSNPSPSRPT